jgi:hypothetical protein
MLGPEKLPFDWGIWDKTDLIKEKPSQAGYINFASENALDQALTLSKNMRSLSQCTLNQ